MITQEHLKYLACPLGKSELRLEADALVCIQCGPRFKFNRQGIPNLLIEEAELPAGCQSTSDLPCQKEKTK